MTSVTETCRDIDQLKSVARTAIILFFQECKKNGINIFVTETFRSQGRQNYLYGQGRTRKGSIVTWTTSSRHSSGLAWDIGASTLNGNSNIYNEAIIKKAGAIAKKLNITWGGTWTRNLDYPHFEVAPNWSIPKGYKIDGKVSIPTRSNQQIIITSALSKLPKVKVVIEEKDEEEEFKVKSLPTLEDATSKNLKDTFVKNVRAAHKDGRIKEKGWVEAAEKGTLNVVDAMLLGQYIHTEPTIGSITNSNLLESVESIVKKAHKDGIITEKWVASVKDGSLSVADTLALYMTIIERYQDKKK